MDPSGTHVPGPPRRLPESAPTLLAAALVVAFIVAAALSVRHVNTQRHELETHRAATTLMEHPLYGSGAGGGHARLGMYLTAVVYAITGPSIMTARAVSIVVGAAAIVVAFLLGRRWFSAEVGLIGAGLLAVSPYYVGLSRYALTEGDAFAPLVGLLLVAAFRRYLQRRDGHGVVVLAAALGMAVATEFLALLLIPPLVICDWLQYRLEPDLDEADHPPFVATHRRLILQCGAALAVGIVGVILAQFGAVRPSIAAWMAALALVVLRLMREGWRGIGTEPTGVLWPARRAWLAVLPLAGAVSLAICPSHMVQPEVLRAALRSAWGGELPVPMTTFIDPLRLYAGIVLLKLGVPFGLMTVAAIVWAWWNSPREPMLRIVLAVVAMYLLLLTALPARHTPNLMMVYPLLMMLVGLFIVRTWRWSARYASGQAAWLAVGVTCGLYLLWGWGHVYPDFGLYGRSLIGDRWIRAESRGYRNVIQVTNDGTEDLLAWCEMNVPPGSRVVSYLWDDAVIDAHVNGRVLPFQLVRRLPEANPEEGPAIDDADYVLVALNNETTYLDLPPAGPLVERFDLEPAHVVYRGRGDYRLPVAWVYQRKPSAPTTAPTP